MSDTVFEFRVWYKPNPSYQGPYDGGCKAKGLHGKFQHRDKAEAAVKACKRYFNTQRVLADVVHPNGAVTQEEEPTVHDNVIVWIESFVDGVLVPEKETGKRKEPQPA